VFVFKSHRRWQRELPAVLTEPRFAHLQVLRFHHPAETDAWLRSLASP
jgi:hypothetical protein